MVIIEEFVLKIKAKTDDLIRGGNEVERQKKKFTDDQKRRDKEDEKRRRKELDHNKQVKRDLLDRIKHTKDLALKITGLAGIFSAVGMAKLTDDTIRQADALQFLSKETGVATARLKAFQDANRLGGGTAEGMTEALKQAASDMALLRQGKSFSELQGGMLLARFGGAAGVDWNEAMSGEADKFLLAKMKVVDWIQKQKKENLGGIDPRQMASQLAIEAGMGGVLNANQDFSRFLQNVQKRQLKAQQWENPNVRDIREDFTELQLDAETILSSIILQAFAPELAKIGKSVGDLKPEDVEKIVKKMQEFIASFDKVITKIWDLSQDKETKKFFDGVGTAVDKAGEAISFVAEKTGGWSNLLTGLIGLRLLAFFASLAGAIGLGAGVGVTGAILAAAGAVALLAGNFDKVKESSKKAIGFVAEKLGLDPEGVKYAYEETVNKASNAMTWISDLGNKITGKDKELEKVIRSGKGWVDVQTKTGEIQRRTGDRNWRNNNPGNIEAGEFARQHGAIGQDSRFAIFPDYQTGRNAQESLIFESDKYKKLNLAQAIEKYAPPGENDTRAYINAVLTAVGTIKQMGDYTQRERRLIMDAMEKVEGFKKGKIETLVSSETGNVTIPQGLRIKSKEALAGGKTEQGTLDLAQAFQDAYPEQVKWFSAFNDKKHQGTGSGHEKGLKFDVTLTDGSGDKSTKMVENLKAIAAQAGVTIKVLDEYKHKSKGWTGPHLDVGFKNAEDAKKFAEYYREKNKKQEITPRAPVIPVDYTGTEPKKALPKPMVVDKGQYNDNTLPINKPIIAKPLPTPLPAPLPPPGATTNNQSAVNNTTINNTFNIKSTEPKAAANEIKNTLDSYANFSNPVVNSFNTGFSE